MLVRQGMLRRACAYVHSLAKVFASRICHRLWRGLLVKLDLLYKTHTDTVVQGSLSVLLFNTFV